MNYANQTLKPPVAGWKRLIQWPNSLIAIAAAQPFAKVIEPQGLDRAFVLAT